MKKKKVDEMYFSGSKFEVLFKKDIKQNKDVIKNLIRTLLAKARAEAVKEERERIKTEISKLKRWVATIGGQANYPPKDEYVVRDIELQDLLDSLKH